jgi:hypothetical protein
MILPVLNGMRHVDVVAARFAADAAMGYPRFGMIDLLKLLGGIAGAESRLFLQLPARPPIREPGRL